MKNAIDKKKKILWIAHRQMLLDQAAESFQKYAFSELIPNTSLFSFRIVSGSSNHDNTFHIKPSDDLLIASKDSIGRNLNRLNSWLKGENEIFLVVDEAHHSTAKTYRRVIDYLKKRVPNLKLIGLTATPFRTAEDEKGLLAKIYSDGIKDGRVVHGDVGITYQIGLKELINRQILSKPIFYTYYTGVDYGQDLGLDALENIQHLDTIPENIANEIAKSAVRNKLIVEAYRAKQKEYGQTIVFAVNVVHAIQLTTLFKKAGVKADYVVSGTLNSVSGVRCNNDQVLENYRNGKIQVLVNVNILTEGVDLPQTKTVFLARPTVSTILMTQMIGRALRGVKAGGTAKAYIVSFIDNWNEHIAWVNPESLFEGNNEFSDSKVEQAQRVWQMVAISKIEEFAKVLDNKVDTSSLEKVPFIQRVPVGMYAFSYLEEDGMDLSYQVMVYDSTRKAYQELMNYLPDLFKSFRAKDEYLSEELLEEMEEQCHDKFFSGEMIPPYVPKDVINILKYYAQYETIPNFYTFDQIDRNKLDLTKIAQYIWERNMGESKKKEYLDSLWDSTDDNILNLYFGRKLYFLNQIGIELMKLAHPELYENDVTREGNSNVKYGTRQLEDLSIEEIKKVSPKRAEELKNRAFEESKNSSGLYQCAICGKTGRSRRLFQIDHIKPMNKGGKSVPENLQILCKRCNGIKGDK